MSDAPLPLLYALAALALAMVAWLIVGEVRSWRRGARKRGIGRLAQQLDAVVAEGKARAADIERVADGGVPMSRLLPPVPERDVDRRCTPRGARSRTRPRGPRRRAPRDARRGRTPRHRLEAEAVTLEQVALGALVACASGYVGSWLRVFIASRAEQYPEADNRELVEMRAHAASEARRYARQGWHGYAAGQRMRVRRYDRALARRGIHHT